jgi:peptidoglycan-associated lipoprotein
MKYMLPLFVAAAVLLFQGCAPKQTTVPLAERVRPATGEAGNQGSAGSTSAGKGTDKSTRGSIAEEDIVVKADADKSKGAGQAATDQLTAQLQDIYFEFNTYTVRPEDVPVLKGVAAWLAGKPTAKVTVEGHCDERGTTDYNLALGQKRAEAAKDYLVKMGVNGTRLKTVSYGKEAPLDPGHSEQAWKKNRRVHFVSP